jgi:crotonobetainyl-CoA:carnitine CoA-transferase CaiB-like acyl-CoA transferase
MDSFEDVDVLDLTQSIAGPSCTQMLASLGANVVKVEPPGGDAFRDMIGGSAFASFNYDSKRSLSVDLKTEEGQELVQELAATSDVVVESFRPGVVSQFDLDYESVSEENEDVVYCSVSGYGQSGPYSEYPAYDPVLQASSGLMSVIGYADRPPARIGASVIDCSTGLTAAFLISSALRHRDRTGESNHIDVSLFDVAVWWMTYWVAEYDRTGETPTRGGSGFWGLAPNDIYHAGDGEPFYLSAINDKLYARTCRTVDREDLVEDDRFETKEDRWENREALREELESAFAPYDRDELVEILAESGIPAGPLQEIPDLLEDDHVEDREMLASIRNIDRDADVRVARMPLRTTEWRPEVDDRPPKLGEHTRAVLSEIGYSEAEIDALLEGNVVFEKA